MKIVKGVLTYTLILIGVLLIAGILLFAGMAFLKFPVFGYRVTMASNQTKEVKTVLLNDVERTIVINSNNYDVKIRPFDDDVEASNRRMLIQYVDSAFGLVSNGHLIDKTNSVIEVLYYNDDTLVTSESDQSSATKIVINLKTPQGILNYRDSLIFVHLPISATSTSYNYNFEINSGKGDIKIIPWHDDEGGDHLGVLTVNGMNITTTTGSVTFYGLKESGEYGNSDSYVEFDYLNLKTEKGKFDFTKQKIKVDQNVKIESSMGDFAFDKIIAGFTIKGENLVFDAGEINTGNKSFLYNCPHGTLGIDTLNVGNQVGEIVTQYAGVDIKNVYGDLSIQATYGKTKLGNTYSNVIDVTTTHGDIEIEHVQTDYVYKMITSGDDKGKIEFDSGTYKGTVACRSTYGDIIVKKYDADGWFTNKKGQINVQSTAPAYWLNGSDNENYNSYETRIETVDGAVYAKGLTGFVNATATGGSNLNLSFACVPNNNKKSDISIGSGKLTLNLPQIVASKSSGFKLTGEMKGGASVDVYNASTKDVTYKAIDFKDGETSKTITDYAAANDYTFNLVSNGGKITIKM